MWGSLAIAIISLFLGDLLDGLFEGLDEFLNPLLLFGTLSVIGGSGVLFTKYSSFHPFVTLLFSVLVGAAAYFLIYHFLVIPMANAEASTSISMADLEGKIGEVITTVPADGMGEVFIESPNGSRSETAKSFDEKEIKQGTRIVIVQVSKEAVYVSTLDDELL
ncbi:protease [Sediminibacillus dalangtanensis]|uniref:Protease n=1 Tax=Sediminibacillus dalangtanensis TaxID=2729421 RepID=A0ABX7VRE9_9BACI|nr:NfeD family protein [Sediminibacillus dalangtanensis]QTM98023.1 protease [Sediminibacillus dalangtanensis]